MEKVVYPGLEDTADLGELREFIGDCQRCGLSGSRANIVFGVGDAGADLMFVGEGPGANEDKQGEPFVGQAGKLLDELLASVGLSRSQVYIANVVKCRPPGNRDPLPDEVASCSPFLRRQIQLIRPKVIASLGNHATKLMTGTDQGISKIHGKVFSGKNYVVFPLYHPAAALYMRTTLASLEADIKKLAQLVEDPDAFLAGGVR